MKSYLLSYNNNSFSGNVELPGSKSISNRLLIMRALANSNVRFKNLSQADDTVILKKLLKNIVHSANWELPMVVNCGNAGTVMRFLTAFTAHYEGKWLITGTPSLMHRPINELVDALTTLGANIKYIKNSKTPPLLITGNNLTGETINIDSSISSQFVSALMLIAPYLKNGLKIVLTKKPVSFAYINMTAALMKQAGINIFVSENEIIIEKGNYKITPFTIENDWSSAAFWYQTAAFDKKSRIFLPGLTQESLQGDKILVDIFEKLGVSTTFHDNGIEIKYSGNTEKHFEYDFSAYPDIVPSVMTTCAVLGITATFKGIEHLRYKESDRIEKLSLELKKTGATIIKQNDNYILNAGKAGNTKTLEFNTHNDHRLAMCLAPLAIVFNKVVINNPEVVNKSYPQFWNELLKTGLINIKESKK